MIQRRNFLAMALAAVMALVGLAAFDTQTAQAKDPQIEGILSAINPTTRVVVIKRTNGTLVNLKIPTTAKVERNGVRVAMTAFKKGDRVQAKFLADRTTIFKFEGTGI